MGRYSVKSNHGCKTYFMRSGKYIKIGSSNSIGRRMMMLQGGNPRKLILLGDIPNYVHITKGWSVFRNWSMGTAERTLHEELHKYHHNGEWFKSTPKLVKYFKAMDKCDYYFPYREMMY